MLNCRLVLPCNLKVHELADHGRGRRQKRLFMEMHERIKEITIDMGLAGTTILIEQRVPDLLGMLVSSTKDNRFVAVHENCQETANRSTNRRTN